MLIQNISSAVPTSQPIKFSGDSRPVVVDASLPSNAGQVETSQPAPQQLQKAVDRINQTLQQATKGLELSIDTSSKTPVVKMMDTETGEIVRQYPSKEVLAIAKGIDQFLSQQGNLLNQKA